MLSIQSSYYVWKVPLLLKACSDVLPFISRIWSTQILLKGWINCLACFRYNSAHCDSANSKRITEWLLTVSWCQESQSDYKSFFRWYRFSKWCVLSNNFVSNQAVQMRETFWSHSDVSVEELSIIVQFSKKGIKLAQGMALLKYIPNPKTRRFSCNKSSKSSASYSA